MILRVLGAGAASLALHLFGAVYLTDAEEVAQIQGGAPGQVARLGNSFADMVSGQANPVTPETVETAVAPQPVAATEAPPVDRPVEAEVRALPPSRTRAEPTEPNTDLQPPIDVPSDVSPTRPTAAPSPDAIAALPNAPDIAASPEATTGPADSATAVQVLPRAAEVTEPSDAPTIAAVHEDTAPQVSERPVSRPVRQAAEKPQERTKQPSRQGSGAQDAVRGQADGARNAASNSASRQTNATSSAGNTQTASNYQGIVLRQLNRVRRPRGLPRGRAVVNFRISPDGAIASVRLLQSSGRKDLDRAAVRHVQRAAPFPPPPRGAKTSWHYSFEITR